MDLNREQFGYVGLLINLEVKFFIVISGPTTPAELPLIMAFARKKSVILIV